MKNPINILILIIALFSALSACQPEPPKPSPPQPAFYHWQTHLQLTPPERQLLDSLNVKKLYVKFFDVDWDEKTGAPLPQAEVQIDTHLLYGLEIVPAIFITNRTFKNISRNKPPPAGRQVKTLADNILQKINKLSYIAPKEIQFDCDWTPSTREKYFGFLHYFKSKLDGSATTSVAATIRLHQLKYPKKTGVPPVDRGMLMFYNMGELDEWETDNSILDLSTADQYLDSPQSAVRSPQYPYLAGRQAIPLDIALPIFRWGVVFRNNELAYLINDLGAEDLRDTAYFYKIAANRYGLRKSTYLHGYYLYKGDRLRLEGTSPGLLKEAAALLGNRFTKLSKFSKPTVAFYHLDTTALKVFNYEDFEKILEGF
ncbi:MAG TPA: hypothetical protein ENJ95_17825 [Bacteroidetes bacterium]|nr:hypothetical protein [Bacteroidota bacterium]